MDYQALIQDMTKRLEDIDSKQFKEAGFFNINEYERKCFEKAAKHVEALMPKHLFILELATSCMFLFYRNLLLVSKGTKMNAFSSNLIRSTNSLISIKLLLKSGLEDTARPLSRQYLENLDICIATIVDDSFAQEYFGDANVEFKHLWENKIAYGRIKKFLKMAHDIAGLDDEFFNERMKHKRLLKDIFSGAVHCDDGGAMRSRAIPVLGYKDKLCVQPHGVVSFHAPNHAANLAFETYHFINLVLSFFISNKSNGELQLEENKELNHTFFSYVNLLDEYLHTLQFEDGSEITADDTKFDIDSHLAENEMSSRDR